MFALSFSRAALALSALACVSDVLAAPAWYSHHHSPSALPVSSTPVFSPTPSASASATSSAVASSSLLSLPTSGIPSSSGVSGSLGSASPSGTASATSTPVPTSGPSTGPHFVVYSDQWVSGQTGPPDPSAIEGFNVLALSFLLTSGAADQAQSWAELTADQRSTIKSQYAAADVKLVVSAFGSTDSPTTSGADPTGTANTIASWVKQFDLDGVDVDYEDFQAMDDGTAVQWLVTFTNALRAQLPAGQYIITHAPVAPWFSDNSQFPGGAYLEVDQQAGSAIDWYNIQFYNQGASEYTTCTGLLTSSSSAWPKTSIFEIAAAGVPLNKLVIGKPGDSSAASNGFMDQATLADCVGQALAKGWNAGVMAWEFPSASSSWIQTVRGSAFPLN